MLVYLDWVCLGRQRGCGKKRAKGPEGRAGSSRPGPALSCGMPCTETHTHTNKHRGSGGHLLVSSLHCLNFPHFPGFSSWLCDWLSLAGMCWNQSSVWGGRPVLPSTLSFWPWGPLSYGTVSLPFSPSVASGSLTPLLVLNFVSICHNLLMACGHLLSFSKNSLWGNTNIQISTIKTVAVHTVIHIRFVAIFQV